MTNYEHDKSVTTEEEYRELAKQAVKESDIHQPDFSYHGDEPVGETWAWCFAKTRDAKVLEISNYESIYKALEDREDFEENEDYCIQGFNHFACGWVDKITVRMLEDDKETVTAIGKYVLDIRDQLVHDYCVFDEQDYSEREHETRVELIQNCLTCPNGYEWVPTKPDDWANILISLCYDSSIEIEEDHFPEDEVQEVAIKAGLMYPDFIFDLQEDVKELCSEIIQNEPDYTNPHRIRAESILQAHFDALEKYKDFMEE